MRLDKYDTFPSGMQEYLSYYGWHFSKKACEYAVSKMRKGDKSLQAYSLQDWEMMKKKFNIDLKHDFEYDALYVLNMAKADFFGSSIVDEAHLAKYVKDYLDDEDGYDEIAFTRYYADIIGKGIAFSWEDMI